MAFGRLYLLENATVTAAYGVDNSLPLNYVAERELRVLTVGG